MAIMTAVVDADARDSEIVHLLAAGVDDAFPALVRAFEDGLFSGLLRMVGNRADAEDLAQETFARAYRSLRDFPPDRILALRLRGWLWTIATQSHPQPGENRQPQAPAAGTHNTP